MREELRTALEKIPEVCRKELERISRACVSCSAQQSKILRGYVRCLRDMGTITTYERDEVLEYYLYDFNR